MDIEQEILGMLRSGRAPETISQLLSTPAKAVTVEDVNGVGDKYIHENAQWAINWLKNAHGGHTPYDAAIGMIEYALDYLTAGVSAVAIPSLNIEAIADAVADKVDAALDTQTPPEIHEGTPVEESAPIEAGTPVEDVADQPIEPPAPPADKPSKGKK